MKTSYLKTIVIVCTVCFYAACSDDALDLQPLDAISEESIYNDINLLNAYVGGRYNAIRTINEGNRMGTLSMSDLAVFLRGEGTAEYYEGKTDPSNGESTTKNLWSHSYKFVKEINIFFENIGDSSLPEADLDQFMGEMHFVRAWIYFELSRWYGGVPIMEQTFSLDDRDFNITRSSYEEVVDYVIKELDTAIPLLPSGTETSRSRATREAAMALKAKMLTYAASELFSPGGNSAKWEAARDANKAIMDLSDYAMDDEYRPIFEEGPLDGEVIFAREYAETNGQGEWSGANVLLWPNGYTGWGNVVPNNKLINMFEMSNGELPYLNDGTTVNPASGFDPQTPYANRDPRFYDIVLYNEAPFKDRACQYWLDKDDPTNSDLAGLDSPSSPIGPWDSSVTGYNFRKTTQEDKPSLLPNFDAAGLAPSIMLRTTEFYLNYAEAQIALGNEDEARNAINAVRARASVKLPPITATGDNLVEAYRKERAIELLLEDNRFFDIRRWKIAENVLGKDMMGVHVIRDNATGTFEYTYDRMAAQNRFFFEKQYLLPIPGDEITRTGGTLTQNPGY